MDTSIVLRVGLNEATDLAIKLGKLSQAETQRLNNHLRVYLFDTVAFEYLTIE